MSHRELADLDFDNHAPEIDDDDEWWREQDAELEQQEMERLEAQADEDWLRRFGYWD